ncbi:MAG: substrate-binding domain-containing protein [Treponema sp.]|nr:substrate-binding domain-containing protein [Candidatus Treponema scatequi]
MSYRVGLILKYLDEEYQASIFRGAAKAAEELGIELICIQGDVFDDSPLSVSQTSFVSAWPQLNLDGIIFLSAILLNNCSFDVSKKIKEVFKNIPLVSVGTVLDEIPSVICEAHKSIEDLLKHLITDHDYKKFLYLGGPANNEDNNKRQKIISDYIKGLNDSSYSLEIKNGFLFSESDGLRLIEEYCTEHPKKDIDAIIAGSDDMASGISKYIKSIAPESWRDCPITGFDDIPLAQTQQLSLTTINQPTEEMGAKAIRIINEILLKKDVILQSDTPSQTDISSQPDITSQSDISSQPDITSHTGNIFHAESKLIIRNSCGCKGYHKTFTEEETLNPLQREQFMRDVTYFGQEIICAPNFEQIKRPLKEFLTNAACRDFSLILFPEPSDHICENGILTIQINDFEITNPHKVGNNTAQNAFDINSTYKTQNLNDIFSSILKRKIDPKTPRCIYQLRVGERRLGFIVYTVNLNAPINMSMAGMFLSQAVNRIYEFDQETFKRRKAEEEVLKISDLERLRFSLDLHDDICQRLAAITMICKKDSEKDETMKTLFNMANETLSRTRQYAHDSFPVELDFSDLSEALENLCSEMTTSDCTITFEKSKDSFAISSEQKINLFRIAQEALQNSAKHSKAKNIKVKLSFAKPELSLTIEDDGTGFDINEITKEANTQKRRPKGLGLHSMEYRTNQIGGIFTIDSKPHKGTSVKITVPEDSARNSFLFNTKQEEK